MSIPAINSGGPSISGGSLGAKVDSQIKTLEQKLSQLSKEKEKAQKAHDTEKVRESEQKI